MLFSQLCSRHVLSVAALVAVFAVGCGGETTEISAAVEDSNKQLAPDGASLECPDEVDGGDGTEFDCTVKGTETGKSAPVKFKVAKDSIAPADDAAYQSALQRVTGG